MPIKKLFDNNTKIRLEFLAPTDIDNKLPTYLEMSVSRSLTGVTLPESFLNCLVLYSVRSVSCIKSPSHSLGANGGIQTQKAGSIPM